MPNENYYEAPLESYSWEEASRGFECHVCGKFIDDEKIHTLDGVYYCIRCKYQLAMNSLVRENFIAPTAEAACDILGERPLLDIFTDVEEDMNR